MRKFFVTTSNIGRLPQTIVRITIVGFHIKNYFKWIDGFSPLLFNSTLENSIRALQESNLGLNIKGIHQVLIYADDVNLLGDDIRTIERNLSV